MGEPKALPSAFSALDGAKREEYNANIGVLPYIQICERFLLDDGYLVNQAADALGDRLLVRWSGVRARCEDGGSRFATGCGDTRPFCWRTASESSA